MSSEHALDWLLPGLTVLEFHAQADIGTLTARATQPTAYCPRCATESAHVHSYYTRKPRDLPIVGSTLRLLLHVRRWRWRNAACPLKTFSEPLPGLLAPAAQRTLRLTSTLQALGLALGGEAGARQSQRQAMPISPDTLLRLSRTIPIPEYATPRVLAVDEFAFRKGRTYGISLIDGEEGHPVDLLPERSAAALATWLAEHPGVEVMTRDRAPEYARGAPDGAPEALQVLDRWHVIGNLHEALARLLDRLRSQLHEFRPPPAQDAGGSPDPPPLSISDRDGRRGTPDQLKQQQSRARRDAVYAAVKALHRQGRTILQIARQLRISRQTVRRYIASEHFPEYSPQPRQPSKWDPYVAYLQERWDAGGRANKQLYTELVAQGYCGSLRPLVQWTMVRRAREGGGQRQSGRKAVRQVERFVAPETAPPLAEGAPKLPGAQALAWLLLADETALPETKQQLLEPLKQHGAFTVATT